MFNKCPGFWQWQSKKDVENIKKEVKKKKKTDWSSWFQSSSSVGRCCWLKQPLPLKTQDQMFCPILLGILYKKYLFILLNTK